MDETSDNKSGEKTPCWRTIGVWGHQKPRCEKLEKLVHCRNCEVFYEAAKSSFRDRLNEHFSLEKSREFLEKLHEPTNRGDLSSVPFRIANRWFGVSTARLDMIAEEGPIHSLPFRSNRFLLGLVAVNGEPVACVNVVDLVGIKLTSSVDSNDKHRGFRRFLITKTERGRIAFRVDEVRDVLHYFMDDVLEKSESESKFIAHQFRRPDDDIIVNVLDENVFFTEIIQAIQ